MFHYYNIFYFCRTEKSMQDYEETQELNTIAPEKTPSPDYPPEVSIEMSTLLLHGEWCMQFCWFIFNMDLNISIRLRMFTYCLHEMKQNYIVCVVLCWVYSFFFFFLIFITGTESSHLTLERWICTQFIVRLFSTFYK